ncbi:hypothetical protein D5086_008250 [Populus alba]|uniref:Uncharacterized protein n=1 Tax=Populus alba TaxID=43335 RepID=A0ACC4CHH5_POPAL
MAVLQLLIILWSLPYLLEAQIHYADTAQILQVGQKLVASVSRGNRSEGSYYLSVASEGLFAFYQANVPQMYYYNRPFGGTVIMGIQLNYSASDNGALCQLIFSDLAGYGDVWLGRSNRCSQTSYMKYDHDGHLRLYYDNLDQPVDLLEDEMDDCDYPTSCGTYGLCSGGRCSCPSGFARDNDSMAQGKNGCLEINPVECENPHQSQSLLTLEDVYYFNYVDDGAAALKETDMKSCQQACLNNYLDYLPSECNNNGSNKKRGSAGQYYHIAAITTIRTKVKKDLLRYICGVYVSPIGVLPSVLFIPLV